MNTLDSLFDWVLSANLRASVLVLAVLLAHWLLQNRLPSRWRYALWLPVLAALLVPTLPLLPSWMSHTRTQADFSEKATSSPPSSQADSAVSAKLPASMPVIPESAQRDTAPPASVNWRAWLVSTWIVGAAGVFLFASVSFAIAMRRIRRATRPVDMELFGRIARTAQDVGLRKVPCVLRSSAVASPAVCGLWRPTLLLNEHFPDDLSEEEAEMVLRHELIHIRRGDLILNALQCALLALHWFNPLLWLASFRVRFDREAACDAQVLEDAPWPRRAAYGHTLLKMETACPSPGHCLGFVGILRRRGMLHERIHAIISHPQINNTMKTTIVLSIIVLTLAGIVDASDKKSGVAKPNEKANINAIEIKNQSSHPRGQEALDSSRHARLGAVLDALKKGDAATLSANFPGLSPEEAAASIQRIANRWGDLSKLTASTEKLDVRFTKSNMEVVEHFGKRPTAFGRWLDLHSEAAPGRRLRIGVHFAKGESEPRQFSAVEWKEAP